MALYLALRAVWYAILLCAGLWLNRREPRMWLLTAVIGIDIFVPIPLVAGPNFWYWQCAAVEIIVALAAAALEAPATWVIIGLSGLLVIVHLTGMYIGPQPGFGPYRMAVPILESAELLSCLLLSLPLRDRFRRMSKA